MNKLTSINPVTNEVLWEGEIADKNQVDIAVKKSREASKQWMLTSFNERESILKKYKTILDKNHELISKTISDEVGKPLWESKAEASSMVSKIDTSIQAYHERTGCKTQEVTGGKTITAHKPHGVVAVLGPFNFPGHLPNGHIVPALLAGNTIVLKPSEQTPFIAELIIQFLKQAGLPDNVVTIVQGAKETGEALAQHPDINGLFFTGSYKTGRLLHENFSGHPEKILALEMGGNNPLVVDEINDIKAAVISTIQSSFITSGQRCTCARRIIVPLSKEGDTFINMLVQSLSSIRVGAPRQSPEPFMGSLISADAAKQILMKQKKLLDAGAKAIQPMETLKMGQAFLSPGMIDITGIQTDDEEIFGPLIQIIRVKNFHEAIQQANNTRYGLSSSLLSDNPEKFKQFYQHVRAGIVNWNRPTTGSASHAPFGGVGCSGNHRPSSYYAADYCAYPCVSSQSETLTMPASLPPGLVL